MRGIRFEPDPLFAEMFVGLQQLVDRDGFVYFLDIDDESIRAFTKSFLYENKLYGWEIPTELVSTFEEEYLKGKPSDRWDFCYKNYWAWFDGEEYGEWLYGTKKGFVTEIDLKPRKKED